METQMIEVLREISDKIEALQFGMVAIIIVLILIWMSSGSRK